MVDLTKKRNYSNDAEWKNSIFFSAPETHADAAADEDHPLKGKAHRSCPMGFEKIYLLFL